MAVAVLEPALGSPLAAALDGLAAVDPASLGERFLDERVNDLLVASDRVASLLAHAIAEGEGRGLAGVMFSPRGHTGSWVAGLAPAKLGRSALAKTVARAHAVTGLPLVAGLHAGGEVSTAFLDAAGSGLRQLPAEAHASWDALLAGEARDLDPGDIAKLLAQVRVMIEPDTVNDEAGQARSSLHISPYGSQGSWAITGTLRGLEGALVASLINHYAKPRDADDLRSRGERNAAALVQIFRMAERSGNDPEFRPAPRGAAGHLVVHANTETWHSRPGAPAATTADGTVLDPGAFETVRCTTQPEVLLHDPVDGDPVGGDLIGGDPVGGDPVGDDPADDLQPAPAPAPAPAPETEAERDARLVRRILAGLIGPEIGIGIEPLAYGRGLRGASRAQWNCLVARDRHCVLPNCTRDPSWCEAHHTREWTADEGPTDLTNMALVCWEHHTWLHRIGQHLHPPWCRCHSCPETRRLHGTPAHQWLTSSHPPVTGDPPTRT